MALGWWPSPARRCTEQRWHLRAAQRARPGNASKPLRSLLTEPRLRGLAGLPPGAASFGEAALLAVVEPEDSDYLFFVSKNDGTHVFSKTYAEHERAVDYYQRRRRSR